MQQRLDGPTEAAATQVMHPMIVDERVTVEQQSLLTGWAAKASGLREHLHRGEQHAHCAGVPAVWMGRVVDPPSWVGMAAVSLDLVDPATLSRQRGAVKAGSCAVPY